MIAFPNAKINIGLNVVRRRADGYHDLETVFYPVKIHDALEVVASDTVRITSSGLDIPGRIADNLCLKAYELIRGEYSLPPVHIHLHKHIPIGAGLGGGSADAGFFIRLLNDKFNLAMDHGKMESFASLLGADCAFFLRNKPVFAFGKGDEFRDISLDLSAYHIVLIMPHVHISTAEAYRGVKPAVAGYSLSEAVNLPVTEWKFMITNDFERTIFKNHPTVRGVKAALYEAGALYAAMSGSGSSVYGIFNTKPDLQDMAHPGQIFYDL